MAHPPSSFWQTTCSALLAGRAPGWHDVADYHRPLELLLAARYGWLPPLERDDLVQDILLAIRQQLFERYSPERGRFRAYLSGVVRNQVRARWRRRQREVSAEALPEPAELPAEEVEALDLVAEALAALRRWHDRWGEADDQRIYVLAGVLIRNETYPEIAKREELSLAAVNRTLRAAREEILGDLLKHTLPLNEAAKQGLDWIRLAGFVREILARPGRRPRILGKVADPRLRAALDEWLDGFFRARGHLPAAGTTEGSELARGLEAILGGA